MTSVREENPHAQAGGIALLLRVGEVVQKGSGSCSSSREAVAVDYRATGTSSLCGASNSS